jgi:hypothetical protein
MGADGTRIRRGTTDFTDRTDDTEREEGKLRMSADKMRMKSVGMIKMGRNYGGV